MRRLLRLILLLAVFLGGYYLGHLPNSPDIFARAGQLYNRLESTTNKIAVKARQEDTSLPEAVLSSVFDSASETAQPIDRQNQSH